MVFFFQTPQPNIRRGMDQYNSLPRQKLIESEQLSQLVDVHRKGVAFGKGKMSLITLKSEKSYSAPNLGDGNFRFSCTVLCRFFQLG